MIARQTKDTEQQNQCGRCRGLMVAEFVADAGDLEWRCVMCGDRVDEVILTRRRLMEKLRRDREESKVA